MNPMYGNILPFFHGEHKSVSCDSDPVGRNIISN
jgi:hypothetical protein